MQAILSKASRKPSSSHLLASKEQAISWLQSQGYRITQARLIMIQILLGSSIPITLSTLKTLTSKYTTINFTTAYRFLKELESKALLQTHIWNNGERRFELRISPQHPSASQERDHHHYVICNQCQTTVSIPDTTTILQLQKKIQSTLGFTDLTHILEFFGTCPKCASNNLHPYPK